jgi:hypothetical protein
MTAMCGRCVNWQLSAETPLAFRKGSTAPCALGPVWTYIHATKACGRFAVATDATVRARRVIVRTAVETSATVANTATGGNDQ